MDFGISFGRGAEKHAMQRGCVVQTQNSLRKTSEKLWSSWLVAGPCFQGLLISIQQSDIPVCQH